MSTTKDGGPAFPVPNDANVNNQMGISIRDYFAAKALQGILANTEMIYTPKEAARDAYGYADAMLAAKEAK